jgi:hypothetical protein
VHNHRPPSHPLATHHPQTRAEYQRKAAILLELLAAQRRDGGEAGAAAAALERALAAFRGGVVVAKLHMVARRLAAATQHGEVRRRGWALVGGAQRLARGAAWAQGRAAAGGPCVCGGARAQQGCQGVLCACPCSRAAFPPCPAGHSQDPSTVSQLQELQALLRLEFERAQATPAMRLLDEVCVCVRVCVCVLSRCA